MKELQHRDSADKEDSEVASVEKPEPALDPEGVRAARPDADAASAREKEGNMSNPDRDVEKGEL